MAGELEILTAIGRRSRRAASATGRPVSGQTLPPNATGGTPPYTPGPDGMGTLPIPPPPISSGERSDGWEAGAEAALDTWPLVWVSGSDGSSWLNTTASVDDATSGVGPGVSVGGMGVGVAVGGRGVGVAAGVSVGGIGGNVKVAVGGVGVQVAVGEGVGGIGVLVVAGLGVLVGVGVTAGVELQPTVGTRVRAKPTNDSHKASVRDR